MPTYEYKCEKCGHRFDVFQRMTDEALKTCPAGMCLEKEWGQGDVRRLLSGGAGLIFKGSGFYITDYAKKNSSAAANSNSNTGASGGEKTESKTSAESVSNKKEAPVASGTKSDNSQSGKS